jgi:DNA-binding NarL/FixJ family response regulator
MTTATTPIKVFIVDDHTIVRQGLRRLLESEQDLCVVGEAKDGLEAVERSADIDADVFVMDLSMPALGGVDATRRILKAKPGARVLVLSMYADPDFAEQALKAGVAGYVTKDAPAEELLGAVKAVAQGGAYFTDRLGPVAERAKEIAQAAPSGERADLRRARSRRASARSSPPSPRASR